MVVTLYQVTCFFSSPVARMFPPSAGGKQVLCFRLIWYVVIYVKKCINVLCFFLSYMKLKKGTRILI